MRLALDQAIEPRRYAFGAAAALAMLDRSILEQACQEQVRPAHVMLDPLWRAESPPWDEREAVLGRIEAGLERLRAWRDAGYGDLERVFKDESDD
jgi:hypothetical protein